MYNVQSFKVKCFVVQYKNTFIALSVELNISVKSKSYAQSVFLLKQEIQSHLKNKEYKTNIKSNKLRLFRYYWIKFKEKNFKWFESQDYIFEIEGDDYE